MKRLLLAVAVLGACGAAFAANTSVAYPAAVGGVVTLNVGEGDVTTYTGTIPSDATSVVKTGLGKAVLQDASADYIGSVTVSGGVLAPMTVTAFGGGDDEHITSVTVEKDATLDISELSAYPFFFFHDLTIAGSGAAGTKGAVVYDRSSLTGNNDVFFRMFKLTDDAVIYFNAGWRIGIMNKAANMWGTKDDIDLGGHQLTFDGEGRLSSHAINWKNGKLRFTGKTNYMIEVSGGFTGSAGSELIWESAGNLETPSLAGTIGAGWTLKVNETFQFQHKPASGLLTWAGDIQIADGKTLEVATSVVADKYNEMKFTGNVQGGVLSNVGPALATFACNGITNNQFSTGPVGQMMVMQGGDHYTGNLSVKGAGALMQFTNCTLVVTNSTDVTEKGWLRLNKVTGSLPGLNAGSAATSEAVDSTLTIRGFSAGGGGKNTFYTSVASNILRNSTITLELAPNSTFYNNGVPEKFRIQSCAELLIDNSAVYGVLGDQGGYRNISTAMFSMPQESNMGSGWIRILGASSVTNIGLHCGGKQGRGAVFQKDGVAAWEGYGGWAGSRFIDFGNALENRGYYILDGGTCLFMKPVYIGYDDETGHGFYVQRGGAAKVTGSAQSSTSGFTVGKNGYAEAYIGGGTFDFPTTEVQITARGTTDETKCPVSVITFANTGTVATAATWLYAHRTNCSETVFNFNSGAMLKARCIKRPAADSYPLAKIYWNFNGGVIAPFYNDVGDGDFAANASPDRATVYDGGAVFDTTYAVNEQGTPMGARLKAPLVAATGKGIASITLPTDAGFLAEQYLGPVRIHIEGAGQGATALVDYDEEARRPRGVIITCPGFGYDENTVVTIESNLTTGPRYTCAFTLADNAGTGPIVKRGDGQMVLSAASQLGGDYVIEKGTLSFDGDVTVTTTVRMTCAAIFGGGGLVATGKLDLSNATFEVSDPENLPSYRDAKPSVCFSGSQVVGFPRQAADYGAFQLYGGGNRLKFGVRSGLLLFVR